MELGDVALPLLVGSLLIAFLRFERELPGRWDALGWFFVI